MIRLRLTQIRLRDKPAWRITVPQADGSRKFKTFTDKAQAKAEFELLEIEQLNHGTSMLNVTPELRSDAIGAARILEPYAVSLTTAASFFAEHHERSAKSETVSNAISALLGSKKNEARPRYYQDLRVRLERFALDFGDRKLAEITPGEIHGWLAKLGVAALTRNTFQKRLSVLWAFGKIQGWVKENIVTALPKAKHRGGEIGILTVGEFSRLLEFASEETRPYWIFGGFCGLRSAELERLAWADVKWESRLVEVPAAKAKTASRRHVELRPNVMRWLAPYRKSKGRVCPGMLRKRLERDRANAGIAEWKPNALRHSFASYTLRYTENANAVALEMGHSNAELLFRFYRELVLPAEAKKYWSLTPTRSRKIIPIAA